MYFNNRIEAADLLAEKLVMYKNQQTLVLAIPRGGVVLGKIIADRIGAELDVYISRKIGAPGNPELAIGAVTSENYILNDEIVKYTGADDEYIRSAVEHEKEEIKRREFLFRKNKGFLRIENRTVILVDDGLATGYTAWAALTDLRNKKPEKLILAVPVASPGTLSKMSDLTDETICLLQPEDFYAVGQFYRDFPQIEDNEVIEILESK